MIAIPLRMRVFLNVKDKPTVKVKKSEDPFMESNLFIQIVAMYFGNLQDVHLWLWIAAVRQITG